MGKIASPALEAMADNLNAAQSAGKFTSALALGNAAKKDEKTIRRILKKENEPALDTVSMIAKVIGLQPWELIKPGSVVASQFQAADCVQRALTLLSAELAAIAPLVQPAARDALKKWLDGAASTEQTAAIIDALVRAGKQMPNMPAAIADTPVKAENEARNSNFGTW